jgi:predicted acylesterase/phospholipase RssA
MGLGALVALQEMGRLDHVTEFIGTSGGSISLAMYLAGLTVEEIAGMCADPDGLMDFDFQSFMTRFGVVKGDAVFTRIEEMICDKTGLSPEFTFQDFKRHTKPGVTFRVCAYSLSDARVEMFDADSCPEMSVVDAIRMSSSIPFFFQACTWKGKMYIDGAVSEYTQLSHIPPDKRDETIVIKTGGDDHRPPGRNPVNILDFFNQVYNAIHPCYRDHLLDLFPETHILNDTVNGDDLVNPIDGLSQPDVVRKYCEAGYLQVKQDRGR